MLRIVILAGVPLAALVGMLVGIYLVADRVLTSRNGCVTCGRPWDRHTIAPTRVVPDVPVRVITPIDFPLPQEGGSQ